MTSDSSLDHYAFKHRLEWEEIILTHCQGHYLFLSAISTPATYITFQFYQRAMFPVLKALPYTVPSVETLFFPQGSIHFPSTLHISASTPLPPGGFPTKSRPPTCDDQISFISSHISLYIPFITLRLF